MSDIHNGAFITNQTNRQTGKPKLTKNSLQEEEK